jgi:hypothetical protein
MADRALRQRSYFQSPRRRSVPALFSSGSSAFSTIDMAIDMYDRVESEAHGCAAALPARRAIAHDWQNPFGDITGGCSNRARGFGRFFSPRSG